MARNAPVWPKLRSTGSNRLIRKDDSGALPVDCSITPGDESGSNVGTSLAAFFWNGFHWRLGRFRSLFGLFGLRVLFTVGAAKKRLGIAWASTENHRAQISIGSTLDQNEGFMVHVVVSQLNK